MQYSKEYKEKLLAEVKQVKSISAVSKKHHVPTATLHGWIKQSGQTIQLQAAVKNKDLKTENRKLKNKLEDTELELMILKDLLKKSYHP